MTAVRAWTPVAIKIPEVCYSSVDKIICDSTLLALPPVGVAVSDIAAGAGGLGFHSRVGQIGQCRQRLSTAATFFRS